MESRWTTSKSSSAPSGPVTAGREAVQEGMFAVLRLPQSEYLVTTGRGSRGLLLRERMKPTTERPPRRSFSTDLQAVLNDPLGDESNA